MASAMGTVASVGQQQRRPRCSSEGQYCPQHSTTYSTPRGVMEKPQQEICNANEVMSIYKDMWIYQPSDISQRSRLLDTNLEIAASLHAEFGQPVNNFKHRALRGILSLT
ncbi:hypothetical protein TURU_065064 [Turdus rufiventris]|nr:hypothetical protein TURU_065064 [Turdus rufiventris]